MSGVNSRYKQIALEIVRRWDTGAEYLVDEHVSLQMMSQGFMVVVLGGAASGKTVLGLHIAKRIHALGARCPALIDEDVYYRFIDIPQKVTEDRYNHTSPWQKIREYVQVTHTSVVVTWPLQRPTCFADIIWLATRSRGRYWAHLMKSRMTNPNGVSPRAIRPGVAMSQMDFQEVPFVKRGLEAALWIRQRYG